MKKIFLGLVIFFSAANILYAATDSEVYLSVGSAEVSSFDTTTDWAPPPEPKATIDGDLLSRWASKYIDEQWIVFDFGKPKTLDKIIIFWEAAYAVNYDILVSQDNQNWQAALSLKDRKGKCETIDLTPTQARYVKILSRKRFNPDWGISIWEVVFLGPKKDNPDDKPLDEVYPQLAQKLAAGGTVEKPKLETPFASPGALTSAESQKGVVYTSWGKDELASPASDKTLEHLRGLGVTNLGIMVVWMQDDIDRKDIYADAKDTPSDEALAHAINKAHTLGMKVMLKPHVDVKTGQWRGDIIPSQDWFASYRSFIIYYAKLAAQYNVELFSIGTELANTTTAQYQKNWEDLIKEVRGVYGGQLTYAANWNEYTSINFWDRLDYVGIDAYFPLTGNKNPAKEELVTGWKGHAGDIDKWLKAGKINKPVIFSEVGYCSAAGTSIQPWCVLSNLPEDSVNQQEQADALDALLTVCSTYPWFKGIYWWNYFPQDRWSPLGYTIKGKKAEEVFSGWLKKL